MADSVAIGQVQLDRFYPPAVSAGEEAKIKAEGKFANWPPQIVCDRNDVQISPLKESGELQVIVNPQAPPGVAWIRLHDDQSASGLLPLIVESQPVLVEAEPNNRNGEAMKIDSPAVVCGRLEKSGDLDSYRIAVQLGQTLVVSLMGNRVLRSPMDAVLQLADDSGNVLIQTDDDCGLDPQLVFPVTADREFLVRVFAFPETPNSTIGYAGNASYVYVLRVTTGGMLDHVLPLVGANDGREFQPMGWNLPNEPEILYSPETEISPPTISSPPSLGWQWQDSGPTGADRLFESDDPAIVPRADRLPFVFSGHIGAPGEVDRVRFSVTRDVKYRVSVESKRKGFLLDSVLRLVNSGNDAELAKNDDRGRNEYDAGLEYVAKEAADVELQISDLVDGFGLRHAYSVIVEQSQPRVELQVSADHFLIKAGSETEIPVNITRLQGFDRRLRVAAEDLPEGVTVEPVFSEEKGDSSKTVKLKLVASGDSSYQGSFRIVATEVDSQAERKGESIIATYALREAVKPRDLWLTVAKEDK